MAVCLALTFAGCKPKDSDIQNDVNTQLNEQQSLSGVSATVENGVVTLTGSVDSEGDRNSAETIARGIKGVDSVHNNISMAIQSDSVHPVPPAGTGLISDEAMMDSAKVIEKQYPGVNISVAAGVITITGTIEQSKKDELMGKLNLLSSKGVNDQLQVK